VVHGSADDSDDRFNDDSNDDCNDRFDDDSEHRFEDDSEDRFDGSRFSSMTTARRRVVV